MCVIGISDKEFSELCKVFGTMNKFEKIFETYVSDIGIRDNDITSDIKLKMVEQTEVEKDDEAKIALHNDAIAGTCIKLLIQSGDDPDNELTLVRKIQSTIYVPVNTIRQIVQNCRYRPWDKRFCISFLLLHEIGHVIDFGKYVGTPLSESKREIDSDKESLDKLIKSIDVDNNNGIWKSEDWIRINNHPIELNANNNVGITESDIKRFARIMQRHIKVKL